MEKDEDAAFGAHDDDVPTGVSARLNVVLDEDDWGLKLGLGANIGTHGWNFNTSGIGYPDVKSLVFIYNAYGWMNFVDGVVNVKAGLIDDAAWAVGGEVDSNVSNGLGIRFEVMPMEGLSFGVFFDAGTKVWDDSKDYFGRTGIGASYTTDMFNVAAGYKVAPDKGGGMMIFGVGFTGVENLDVFVDGKITDMADFKDSGFFDLYEEFSYTLDVMEGLKVGLVLYQGFNGKNLPAYPGAGYGKAEAKEKGAGDGYTTNNDSIMWAFSITPKAEIQITESFSAGFDLPIHIRPDSTKEYDPNSTDEWAKAGFGGIDLNLWLKYTLGGSFITLGYGFTTIPALTMRDIKPPAPGATWVNGINYPAQDNNNKGKDIFNNYIKLVFGYSF